MSQQVTPKRRVERTSLTQTNKKRGPLKKITLSWEAGSRPDAMDLTSGPALFEFIYSLGAEGLSPFEYELADKEVGDIVSIHGNRRQISEIFEHLEVLLLNLPKDPESFYLRLKVIEINPEDQREVIKAMAETASCGDHCCGH
jgi:hypothetical protein